METNRKTIDTLKSFTSDQIRELVNFVNLEAYNIAKVAEEYHVSKKTVQMVFKNNQYQFSRVSGRWYKPGEEQIKAPKERVLVRDNKSEEVVARTYLVPKQLDKQIKLWSFINDMTSTEIVIRSLTEYINKDSEKIESMTIRYILKDKN